MLSSEKSADLTTAELARLCTKKKFFGERERSEFHLRLEQFAGERRAECAAQEITTTQIALAAQDSLLGTEFQET